MGKRLPPTVAVMDTETDPFRQGRVVRPFVCGFYDGAVFLSWWGDDCLAQFVAYLRERPDRLLIYAHNGGRFDFLFSDLLTALDEAATIINGRIVRATVGHHELRDSYAILPVALRAAGDKGVIDYKKMRRAVREQHRAEIVRYLATDCTELHRAVTAYRERFGNKLTMAGAAIAKLDEAVAAATGADARQTLQRLALKARHGQDTGSDPFLRQFFYGGRTEYFERGILRDAWRVYDVNSMYPDVMARETHPTGNVFVRQRDLDDHTDFALIDATSAGALPFRARNGGLSFPHGRAEFHATGHEIRAALDLGLLSIHRIVAAYHSPTRTDFAAFVLPYYALRQEADAAGDATGKLHYKLVLNSSYGRFALQPDKLREWQIIPRGFYPPADGGEAWRLSYFGDDVTLWSRPATEAARWRAIRNVGTGASITGAARAKLLRALTVAERPIYCDTDSVICRDLPVDLDARRLGAWKLETSADLCAIAGKKTYALFQGRKPVKWASKGAQLSPHQIKRVAEGRRVRYIADAPTINLAGVQGRLMREITLT